MFAICLEVDFISGKICRQVSAILNEVREKMIQPEMLVISKGDSAELVARVDQIESTLAIAERSWLWP